MAFYTAQYIRTLVKQDHLNIQKFLSNKANDFRKYIDTTLPFTLYIDIENLESKVATDSAEFVVAAAELSGESTAKIVEELLKAYKGVINSYIADYPSITSEELSIKLSRFMSADLINTPYTQILKEEFDKTFTISNISKKDKSVLIVSPTFKTIQSVFGAKFRNNFNLDAFSDDRRNNFTLDSPRQVMSALITKDFGKLQNLGHVEADILSTTGSEVKRGIVTPKLLSAILELPKDTPLEPMVKKFSKETGQAETRIVIRKKFSGSKLVFEMLIEAGFLIGNIESRKENLSKAPKEMKFALGKGLTEKIRQDKNFLANLETSKSISQYAVQAVLDTITNGKVKPYTSSTTIVEKTPISVNTTTVAVKKTSTGTKKISKSNVKRATSPLISLEALLRANINEQVAKNMGSGSESRVLNYRTGRFSSSVEIDKLSESRQGLISVFYRYMKNPYATFSEGGRQQYPKTRDPKLLISKSIREIAAPIVGNRLRSVAV